MYSIDEQIRTVIDLKTGLPIKQDYKKQNPLDLKNLNVYDMDGNLIKAADINEYHAYFARIIPQRAYKPNLLRDYLEHQYRFTPDKPTFLENLESNILFLPPLVTQYGAKKIIKQWINGKRNPTLVYIPYDGIDDDRIDYLNSSIEEIYEEYKGVYFTKNGSLVNFHKICLSRCESREAELSQMGANRDWIEDNELIKTQDIIKFIKEKMNSENEDETTFTKKFELVLVSKSQKTLGKPKFKPEKVDEIFYFLKDFFATDEQCQFKELLEKGEIISKPILFLDNGNRLADAFKQLFSADIITGCQKKELEAWIAQNFNYLYRGGVKKYTLRYLNDIISTGKVCERAVLNVKLNKETGDSQIIKG